MLAQKWNTSKMLVIVVICFIEGHLMWSGNFFSSGFSSVLTEKLCSLIGLQGL